MKWFRHLERMDDERMLKKVVNARVYRGRAKRRRRLSWMDEVRSSRDRDIDVRQVKEHYRDRNEWRMIVRKL